VRRKDVLCIAGGQVDVWLTSLAAVSDELRSAYAQLLSESERTRCQRFLVAGARDQYLVGRALIRTSLSRYADVRARDWSFAMNQHGRPDVAEPAACRDLKFNLSHTNGLVCCAVTRANAIGVDVEDTDRTVDPLALAPSVFAPAEIDDVAAATGEGRYRRFFSYWTLKEAYIKARGMGLALPLDGFWFDLRGASPRIHFTEQCPDRSERWHFYQWTPTLRHRLALAVAPARAAVPEIRLHWVVPGVPGSALRADLPVSSTALD